MELFGILYNSFESGSVTVDFDYNDRWDNTRGAVTIHTDNKNNETAFEVEFSTDGFDIDLELFVNRERTAARVSQIDNNFYGIKYDTFKDDFKPFADLLGLDRDEIDMIIELVDFYADSMNVTGDAGSAYSQYGELIKKFITGVDINEERVDFISDGKSIRVKKIELTISESMIIGLLYDLLDLMENDDSIRSLFEANYGVPAGLYPFYQSPSFNEIIQEIRTEIRNLERELRGELKIAFYIGSRDRLMRMEVDFNFLYDRDRTEFTLSMDFGSSANDLWVFSFNSRDGRDSTIYSISWNIKETSRGGETTLTMDSENRYGIETLAVILDWNDRGYFTLSFKDEYSSEDLLSGTYTKIKDGFELVIDDPYTDSRWDESLQLKISAITRSGHIAQIDYINIADWGTSLIDKIGEFFNGTGSIYSPPISPPPFGDSSITEADLYGAWRYSHGDITYFFWTADLVMFFADGEVISSDSDNLVGIWTLVGNSLSIVLVDGTGSYEFTLELNGDTLAVMDSDNDIGYFVRTN